MSCYSRYKNSPICSIEHCLYKSTYLNSTDKWEIIQEEIDTAFACLFGGLPLSALVLIYYLSSKWKHGKGRKERFFESNQWKYLTFFWLLTLTFYVFEKETWRRKNSESIMIWLGWPVFWRAWTGQMPWSVIAPELKTNESDSPFASKMLWLKVNHNNSCELKFCHVMKKTCQPF